MVVSPVKVYFPKVSYKISTIIISDFKLEKILELHNSKSKNSASLYVIKSVYNSKNQSNSSKIAEKLGTETELREKLNGADPYE